MKVFVSGKIGKEQTTAGVVQALRNSGHEIVLDWTLLPHTKPYSLNKRESARVAELEANGVRDSDLLVLLDDEQGVGLFVELGVAIGAGKPAVVMTKNPDRTIFFHHPSVVIVQSVEALVTAVVSRGG